jgi:hypothetical protein
MIGLVRSKVVRSNDRKIKNQLVHLWYMNDGNPMQPTEMTQETRQSVLSIIGATANLCN